MSIVSAVNFDESKLTISAPKVLQNANGARQSYTNYNDGKFIVQTPKNMSVPFGLDVFRDESSGKESFSMNLSLRGYDSDPTMKVYYNMLKKVDDIIIEEAFKNRKTWFPKNKDISKDTIRTLYKSPLKESYDDNGNMKYAPVHKIKFKKDKEGKFEVKLWDEAKQAIKDKTISDIIMKGVSISVIVRCAGITFAGAGFSSSWVAEQIMVHKMASESLNGCAFEGFDDASASTSSASSASSASESAQVSNVVDDDILNAVMPSVPASASAPAPVPASNPLSQFADDDDDDESGDEEEPIPAPKKPIVKKTVIAKKK
jgi:hypothetical protein